MRREQATQECQSHDTHLLPPPSDGPISGLGHKELCLRACTRQLPEPSWSSPTAAEDCDKELYRNTCCVQARRMLREGDTNGDGLVCKEEFMHLLQARPLAGQHSCQTPHSAYLDTACLPSHVTCLVCWQAAGSCSIPTGILRGYSQGGAVAVSYLLSWVLASGAYVGAAIIAHSSVPHLQSPRCCPMHLGRLQMIHHASSSRQQTLCTC